VGQIQPRGGEWKNEEAKSKVSPEAFDKSAAKTVKMVGVSQATVEGARTVLSAPEEKEAVLAGEEFPPRLFLTDLNY